MKIWHSLNRHGLRAACLDIVFEELTPDNWMEHHYRHVVLHKLEHLVLLMQHPDTGVNFRPQKMFLTAIPAAVSGSDLIEWISKQLHTDTLIEANHIANMLLVYGYVYSLTDIQALSVENDSSVLYRFQAPYFWLSMVPKPDAMDYAIYLLKRNMRGRQKFRLEEYELVTLEKLEKILCDKWEFIYLQAEEQVRMGKERKKADRMVIDSQEQAFWQMHRPPPGRPCRVEESVPRHHSLINIQHRREQQLPRMSQSQSNNPAASAGTQRSSLKRPGLHFEDELSGAAPSSGQMSKATALMVKSLENLLLFNCHHSAYDWFCGDQNTSGDSHNLWILSPQSTLFVQQTHPQGAAAAPSSPSAHNRRRMSEDSEEYSGESPSPKPPANQTNSNAAGTGDQALDGLSEVTSVKQLRLWATGFNYLLRDQIGRRQFEAFLLKEFSAENLRFYMAVNDFKFGPVAQLNEKAGAIFAEFLQHGAPSEINIDSKTKLATEKELQHISRFTFEDAQEHIYNLMKNDSYVRYLRSEDYANALRMSLEMQHSLLGGGKATPGAPLSASTGDPQKAKAPKLSTGVPPAPAKLGRTPTEGSELGAGMTIVKGNAVVPWEDDGADIAGSTLP